MTGKAGQDLREERLNDRQLRYVYAVWKERSFSRAAEKLNVSQPSLSDQVRQLEEELGFSVFYRNPRGVEPSVVGLTFLKAVEAIVRGMADLSQLADELRGRPGLKVRIGLSAGLSQTAAPAIWAALTKGHRRIRLEMTTATSRRIQRLLYERRLDFAILFEGEIKDAGYKLAWHSIATTELVLLVPATHAFATRTEGIAPQELHALPLIVNEPRAGYCEMLLKSLAVAGAAPDIVAECDDMEALKHLVLSNAGIAAVPSVVVRREIEQTAIVAVPLVPKQIISINFVRRPEPLDSRLEQQLNSFIEEFSL